MDILTNKDQMSRGPPPVKSWNSLNCMKGVASMRYQRDQHRQDERRIISGDTQQHSGSTGETWSLSLVNYCPTCGIPIRSWENQQHTKHHYHQDARQFNQTYQNRPSGGNILFPIGVIIVILIVVVSCNVSASSAASDLPSSQSVTSDYIDNSLSSEKENKIYEVSMPAPTNTEYNDQQGFPYEANVHTYIVKPGDTVYHIAQETLGNGSRWVEIDQLNHLERLSNGSVLIHPGQVLIIPGF